MYAVIFEVIPKREHVDDYLDTAVSLLADLQKIDGFISIERFSSLAEEGKLLSLSFWRDEEAIQQWREHIEHGKAQKIGRYSYFKDYRLRVGQIVRDYGPNRREQAPQP